MSAEQACRRSNCPCFRRRSPRAWCWQPAAFLARRAPFLDRYGIPTPIIGGLIFAVLALLANRIFGLAVTFDTSAKPPSLLLFFASIGLTADLVLLRPSGIVFAKLSGQTCDWAI
jgi:sodium--glutamate symport carrier gltS